MMGLLAELSIRTYHESQGKRTYVVREFVESTEPVGTRGSAHSTPKQP